MTSSPAHPFWTFIASVMRGIAGVRYFFNRLGIAGVRYFFNRLGKLLTDHINLPTSHIVWPRNHSKVGLSMWHANATADAGKVSEDARIEKKPSNANARPTDLTHKTFSNEIM